MKSRLPRKRLAELETLLDAAEPDTSELIDIDCALIERFNEGRVADDLSNLTPAQRGFYVSWLLEGEVNNGGFNQFLLNQGPVVAREAMAFCQARGLGTIVDLLQRAIAALPGGALPDTYDELEAILANDVDEDGEPGPIDRAHGELDDVFFDGNLDEPLMLQRLRWVREHADDFFAPEGADDAGGEDAGLLAEIEADALDLVELVTAIEEAFGILIPDEAAEQFAAVGDIIDQVAAQADPAAWPADTIEQRVRGLTAEILGVDAARVDRSSRLVEGLGAD